MAENTKIEWATHTFNPWRGCTKISDGCRNCYADTMSHRNPSVLGVWGPNGTRVVAAEAAWKEPLKWNNAAKAAGERHRVFCASMADVFEDWQGDMVASNGAQMWKRVDGSWTTSDHYRDTVALTMQDVRCRLFELIDNTPNLNWLLVTKRPENISRMMSTIDGGFVHGERIIDASGIYRPNVWLGTSVENQQAADERIPQLLKAPAHVRFLSCEPLLGPIDLTSYGVGTNNTWRDWLSGTEERPGQFRRRGEKVDWVIVGGESGHNARPMHPKWARSLRDQCKAADVAFHFKQWGEYAASTAMPADRVLVGKRWEEGMPDGEADEVVMYRVGKEKAGRMLDGRTWDEVPS